MDRGIFYPLAKGLRGGESPANHSRLVRQAFRSHLPLSFSGKEYKSKDSLKENTGKQATQGLLDNMLYRAQGRDMLIIAENISTLSEEELQEFAEFFAKRSYSIELYCCLRRPKEWLNSLLAQRVAGEQGPGLVMPHAIVDLLKQNAGVAARARKMESWQSDCHFFSFEQAIAHPQGLFANFLELIGLETLELDVSRRDNSRYSDLAVRLISQLMSSFGHRTFSVQANNLFLYLQRLPLLKQLPGRSFSLLAREVKPFESRLAADNEWLGEKFGSKFCDSSARFPTELEPIDLIEALELLQNSHIEYDNVRQAIEKVLRTWPRQ